MKDRGNGPALTRAMFHILLSLADAPRHGLGIVHEVEERTGGVVRLGAGVLYTSIRKLADGGYIEEPPDRPPPNQDDPRRRYYRVTRAGRRVLRAEASHLERLVRVAREKNVLNRPAHG